MSLNSNALITLDQFKSHLGMPSSNILEDARLEMFINAASERIASYCDRVFKTASYTELHSGRRQNYILPNQYPITAISEIRVSNARDWSDATGLLSASSYVIADYDTSVQYDGILPGGFNNVRIVYTAGYVTIPTDLQLACLWFAEWYYRHRSREDMGKTTISKGDESIGILSETPKMIMQILIDYQRCEFNNTQSPVRNS